MSDPEPSAQTLVAWVLSGDINKASSRLQGINIHQWLQGHGVASRIFATQFASVRRIRWSDLNLARQMVRSGVRVVVFEGPEWGAVQLARICSALGIVTIAVRCDRMPAEYDRYFDLTILPTEGLALELGVQHRRVIEDSVEVPPEIFKRSYEGCGPLKVVWMGHAGYEHFIVGFVRALKEKLGERVDFEIISNGPFASRQWSLQTVMQDMLACDLAILPIPEGEWFRNKSSNRLAMCMALGLPTIATPIDAYRALGVDGHSVLFAEHGDFADKILELASVDRRRQIGENAREVVMDRFSIDRIAPQWRDALLSAPRRIYPGVLERLTARVLRLF